ncbi:hypothetical protein MtrunA17_Chr7g0252491 [Medicago truncatula]|uniref:Transmembrane protein, putative n=1 Tax=Medicago truncatula TaxID=3880 RepID=Q2HRW3_MEDTR|nr:uncharacterized protein LOC11427084 [Medicago truncatula]ABD33160.1 Protein of unknown function DUF716 [Medicago truncatula]AES80752.1 transmembrane protein, putative [Medicago truncatula]RHN47393.1 hypothetical protein MtrunA17_Chr7g0252491 [Medicago truncatula]
MGSLLYQALTSSSLILLGLYHLIFTTLNYLKSPHNYTSKPYHPLPTTSHPRLRPIQLYFIIFSLSIAILHHLILATDNDPLIKGSTPVHRLTSLQSASLLFLFLLLSLSLLLPLRLPHEFSFSLLSLLFLLHSSLQTNLSSLQTSSLEAKCDSVSSNLSALASFMCLLLTLFPRLFPADVGLAASLCLRGFWALQTGLTLYADPFIPEGCHRLLDVVNGVEGSTKCDLDESKFRALAILDLAFVVYVMLVMIVVLVVYAVVASAVGGVRRVGSYESLPTAGSSSPTDSNHIQMKALAGTQA